MFRRSSSLSFSDSQKSVKGMFSLCLGMIAVGICVLAVVISYKNKGQAGDFVGSCGIMAFLSAVMGLVFGIGGLREGSRKRMAIFIGILLSAVVFVGLIVLFVKGM